MIADYEGDITNLFNSKLDGELPILPTRNLVVFPGVISPILIGRQSSVAMIEEVMDSNDGTSPSHPAATPSAFSLAKARHPVFFTAERRSKHRSVRPSN